jgi:hypothetical protein
VNLPGPSGAACDDRNPCTAGDACRNGTCNGAPVADQTVCTGGCCVSGLCCTMPGCCR